MSLSQTANAAATTERLFPSRTKHPFKMRSFGMTDPGRVRPANEDHFAIVELARTIHVRQTSLPQETAQYSSNRGHILLVADGMGGHRAGAVASALSVMTVEAFLLNTFRRFFFNLKTADEQNVLQEFRSALLQADARIFEAVDHHPELVGMGTTLTMAFAVNWKLFIAHAGDSRCYLFSKDHLAQITQDHTVVAELVRQGALSPKEAFGHPYRHVVTNALGGSEPGVQVELHQLDLEPGDLILLCTDGLTEMLPDDRITAVLAKEADPERACTRLINDANAQGGKDNVTAVVAVFEDS